MRPRRNHHFASGCVAGEKRRVLAAAGEILKAADRLAMGPVARVVYEFDPRFWEQFASLERGELPLCSGVHSPDLVDDQPAAKLVA